jgi:hypothetical protein
MDESDRFEGVYSLLKGRKPQTCDVSGQGGAGKSFLVKIIIKHLRTKVIKKVAIVCSTGIAATNYTEFGENSEHLERPLEVALTQLPSFLLTSIKMSKSACAFKDKIVQRSRQL